VSHLILLHHANTPCDHMSHAAAPLPCTRSTVSQVTTCNNVTVTVRPQCVTVISCTEHPHRAALPVWAQWQFGLGIVLIGAASTLRVGRGHPAATATRAHAGSRKVTMTCEGPAPVVTAVSNKKCSRDCGTCMKESCTALLHAVYRSLLIPALTQR
jgi:hypothetical protein